LQLQKEKTLSFREKKMLDRARHMLVTETSIARMVTEVGAEEILNESLAKASLKLPEPL
jgi:CarD family transcriptional regulator